jgi:hypothetical protein
MAVMIVSGSIPFSLASASIVCINGFCIISSADVTARRDGPRPEGRR